MAAVYRVVRRAPAKASLLVGLAVFSHWILDFIVHVPDLPLYDNAAKVGLGLWNQPWLAFGLEAVLLLGSVAIYFQIQRRRRGSIVAFSLAMLAMQAYIFFGPPPASSAAIAATALGAYGLFAFIIWLLADRRVASQAA
jgi:hypothetical protein